MPSRSPSKQRLEELIALARTYRGWSNKDLARELGRDVHHLVPDSGVPKLDIVIALADALDWTVQDVVDDLCGNVPVGAVSDAQVEDSFATLDRAAWDALQAGAFERAAMIARRAFFTATSGEERAIACMREIGAWDGVGRYQLALECAQRGLRNDGISVDTRLALRNNLANCHYVLGNHEESVGISSTVIDGIAAGHHECPVRDLSHGFASYVRGATIRAKLAVGASTERWEVDRALADLRFAAELLASVGKAHDAASTRAIAETCRGARLAVSAMAGDRDAGDVIDAIAERLNEVVDPSQMVDTHHLESIGWWCVFGCEVALRSQVEPERLESLLAIFTNKVDEISRRTGNWALRERVWYFELMRRKATGQSAHEPWILDLDDAREVAGAMARFPGFRAVGWEVFRAADIGGGR